MKLEGTSDRGAQECGFGHRAPWSELLKLLDEWEALELKLVGELLDGDIKGGTCGKLFRIKKMFDYHERNRHVGLNSVISVTNTLTV